MMNPIVTRSALERAGHLVDPHPVYRYVGLRRCRECGRVWSELASTSYFGALVRRGFELLEPTGWTFESPIDDARPLTPIEALLWNVEPCPGPPRDYPGALDNALYRLLAYGILDVAQQAAALRGELPLSVLSRG
jgi:hypothetical protein